jgi:hypothetical protein
MTPSNPTPDAELEAREEILAALWDGNSPTCEYYGPDDPHWNRAKRVCQKENEQQADAYRTAVRTALLAEIVEMANDVATHIGEVGMPPIARSAIAFRNDFLDKLTQLRGLSAPPETETKE